MVLRAVRVTARTYDPRRSSGRENRWNAAGQAVVYLSEHFSTALLEMLVHSAGVPVPCHAAWATIRGGVSVEELDVAKWPGWDDLDDQGFARAAGSKWFSEHRSACLLVPSVPGRPFERNIVVNTTHKLAGRIVWETTVEVPWDPRVFG
ncbi:MAG: RES domain-containing protein [Gemmatimonadaceae bacterium]